MLPGQINWVARKTRPDMLYECRQLASCFKNANVADILKAFNQSLQKYS